MAEVLQREIENVLLEEEEINAKAEDNGGYLDEYLDDYLKWKKEKEEQEKLNKLL